MLSARNPYFLDVISGLGRAGFFSLFLGWLAAIGEGPRGARQSVVVEKNVQPIRKAAAWWRKFGAFCGRKARGVCCLGAGRCERDCQLNASPSQALW